MEHLGRPAAPAGGPTAGKRTGPGGGEAAAPERAMWCWRRICGCIAVSRRQAAREGGESAPAAPRPIPPGWTSLMTQIGEGRVELEQAQQRCHPPRTMRTGPLRRTRSSSVSFAKKYGGRACCCSHFLERRPPICRARCAEKQRALFVKRHVDAPYCKRAQHAGDRPSADSVLRRRSATLLKRERLRNR